MSIRSSFRAVLRLAVLYGAAAVVSAAAQTAPLGYPEFAQPDGEAYLTDDGTVALAWTEEFEASEGRRIYEVRRWLVGGDAEGVVVYEGADRASFLSGLSEGLYRLKVRSRSADGEYPEWGEQVLTVEVKYIGRGLLIGLMTAGFITFVAIFGSIAYGHRAAKREEAANR